MSKDDDEKEILNKVFKLELPKFALRQIAEYSLCLLDKIFTVPSEWINAISPLIIWFTLHTEDGLI
jgi:hypothetical protein